MPWRPHNHASLTLGEGRSERAFARPCTDRRQGLQAFEEAGSPRKLPVAPVPTDHDVFDLEPAPGETTSRLHPSWRRTYRCSLPHLIASYQKISRHRIVSVEITDKLEDSVVKIVVAISEVFPLSASDVFKRKCQFAVTTESRE